MREFIGPAVVQCHHAGSATGAPLVPTLDWLILGQADDSGPIRPSTQMTRQ